MFMRFRGGGVGHKPTRDWDEFLQREGREVRQDFDSRGEEEEEVLSEEEENDAGDEGNRGENASDEEHEPDQVVADEGEELDEDIWAQEGYGAL